MSDKKTLCSNCGKEREIEMHSLISDLCEDRYEKVNRYTPENEYTKEYIKQEFYLPDGNYSIINIIKFYSDCEIIIKNKVIQIGKNKNKIFACMFSEFDKKSKLEEIIKNKHFELEFSYFFKDSKFELEAKFEDRKKEKIFIICID